MGLGMVFNLWDWFGGLFIAFGVFLVVWVLITRRFAKRLQPAMMRVQQQMQAGHPEFAMDSLKDMLPMANWVPLLRGQLLTQLGMISMHTGKKEEAVKWLEQAPPRAAEAQLALASLEYTDGNKAAALKRLGIANKKKPKHVLLANAYAWLLHKEKRVDDAIQVLHRHINKQRASPVGKENHLRLQNGRPMKMEPLGMEWYGLKLERPPQSMIQQQMPSGSGGGMRKGGVALPAQGQMPHQGRKGFRQEAKNKGKQPSKAKGKK